MLLKITPGDKRLKQLVKEYGNIWRFKKYSPRIQSCKTGCYYSESIDGTHQRWIEAEFVKEL